MVYLTGLDLTTQTQKLPELKVGVVQETPALDQPQEDPMIAKGEENIVYFGVLLLAASIVTVIGILNRRLDYALGFAFVLSVIIIAILVIV